jgi:hypothetical protein
VAGGEGSAEDVEEAPSSKKECSDGDDGRKGAEFAVLKDDPNDASEGDDEEVANIVVEAAGEYAV